MYKLCSVRFKIKYEKLSIYYLFLLFFFAFVGIDSVIKYFKRGNNFPYPNKFYETPQTCSPKRGYKLNKGHNSVTRIDKIFPLDDLGGTYDWPNA